MKSLRLLLFGFIVTWSACSSELQNQNMATDSQQQVAQQTANSQPQAADVPISDTDLEIDTIAQTKPILQQDSIITETTSTPTKAVAEAKKATEKTTEKTTSSKKEAPLKPKKKKKRPAIKFDKTVHEFGIIKPGEVINHKFYFTNTGKANLVIKDADVTCGCTTPSYPFVPIEPGERGFIGVTYDSKGKLGKQRPTVTLSTNAGTKKIYMDGYVISEMAKKGTQTTPHTNSN